MSYQIGFAELVICWLVAIAILISIKKQSGQQTVYLPLAYLAGFALLYLPGAALYIDPVYWHYDRQVVWDGFFMSTIGVAFFVVGALIATFWLNLRTGGVPSSLRPVSFFENEQLQSIARLLVICGFVSYFFIFPVLGRVSTVSSIVSGLNQLSVIGVCLGIWAAHQRGDKQSFRRWYLLAFMFPFIKLVNQGFLGFGVRDLIIVTCFVFVLKKISIKVYLTTFVFGFLALSFYVSYMRDRDVLREMMWYHSADLGTRVEQVGKMFVNFEFFDTDNHEHLFLVDKRLNQNQIVGEAVRSLESGRIDYANGETVFAALVALVPRAIWPDKPYVGGGMGIVEKYTELEFVEGTSVGTGQVFEFYINYGTTGVVVGFLILGFFISYSDRKAGIALHRNDLKGFIIWFLPALGFLQAGGNLAEVTTTVGASIGSAYLVVYGFRRHLKKKTNQQLYNDKRMMR